VTTLELFAYSLRQGIRLETADEKIHCRGPRGYLTPALVEALKAHKPELIELLLEIRDPHIRWRVLAAAGLDDIQVVQLSEALFLFALRTIERTPAGELPAVWSHYGRYWEKRLDPKAYQQVAAVYLQRLNRNPLNSNDNMRI
jgi:hypothetical protein